MLTDNLSAVSKTRSVGVAHHGTWLSDLPVCPEVR